MGHAISCIVLNDMNSGESMGTENKKWILKERPIGLVKDSDFELVTETLREIKEGEILLENMYLSFDPTQRGWLMMCLDIFHLFR